jgi:rod shape-determining protein MreB and related proteins
MNRFVADMGIDLGTAHTLVYVKGKGILLDEPSVVAIYQDSKEILAIGSEARDMIGRNPGNIRVIRPLKDGVIAHFDATKNMLRHFMTKAGGKQAFLRRRVIVSVPSGITSVERHAVIDATISAGAREAYLIEEPVAAAIGAGLPVQDPIGSMIINIGSGTTEVAIVCLGGLVVSKSTRIGGDAMDEAIIRHLRREHNFMVGERTAEQIKMEVGSAYPLPEQIIYVKGRDLSTGLPKTLSISSKEVYHALQELVREIVEATSSVLEDTPPDLVSDIIERGLMMTGGGALLKGFPELLSEKLSIPVMIADKPMLATVMGAGKALDEINTLKNVLFTKKQ